MVHRLTTDCKPLTMGPEIGYGSEVLGLTLRVMLTVNNQCNQVEHRDLSYGLQIRHPAPTRLAKIAPGQSYNLGRPRQQRGGD